MTDSPSDDRHVIDTVLGGDTGAFRALVDREAPQVLAICRRILGNPAEAEDVAQDTFVQAYRSLATYRGDGPFAAWIARIAARQSVARLVARPKVAQLEPDDPAVTTLAHASADEPESLALAGEQQAAIREAVAALPATQRAVVSLRYFQDLSLEEIAETTRTPVGTVKSRLHRGLANLRGHLASRSSQ